MNNFFGVNFGLILNQLKVALIGLEVFLNESDVVLNWRDTDTKLNNVKTKRM